MSRAIPLGTQQVLDDRKHRIDDGADRSRVGVHAIGEHHRRVTQHALPEEGGRHSAMQRGKLVMDAQIRCRAIPQNGRRLSATTSAMSANLQRS